MMPSASAAVRARSRPRRTRSMPISGRKTSAPGGWLDRLCEKARSTRLSRPTSLSRKPLAPARDAVLAHGRELTRAWRPLFAQAMGEAGGDRELVEYAFLALRGFLAANTLSSGYTTAGEDQRFRRLLEDNLARHQRLLDLLRDDQP